MNMWIHPDKQDGEIIDIEKKKNSSRYGDNTTTDKEKEKKVCKKKCNIMKNFLRYNMKSINTEREWFQ